MKSKPKKAAKNEFCGFEKTGPTGVIWVCVRPVHGPKNGNDHYFVRKPKEI